MTIEKDDDVRAMGNIKAIAGTMLHDAKLYCEREFGKEVTDNNPMLVVEVFKGMANLSGHKLKAHSNNNIADNNVIASKITAQELDHISSALGDLHTVLDKKY